MSLRIIQSANADFISRSLLEELEQARNENNHPICLVPTFEDVDDLKMSLANEGIGFGVEVFTVSTFLENMWRMWGDGRSLVSNVQRYISMRRALMGVGIELSPGAIRFATSIAKQSLGYVLTDGLDESEIDELEIGYQKLYDALNMYAEIIEEQGFIEPAHASILLSDLMRKKNAQIPALYIAGFSHIPLEHLPFIAEFSRIGAVSVVFNMQDTPSFDLDRESQGQLIEVLNRRGLTYTTSIWDEVEQSDANEELQELSSKIYTSQDKALESQGHVDLVMPAGLRAESEALARKVDELVDAGFDTVHICTKSPEAVFTDLQEKLAARSISLEGILTKRMVDAPIYHNIAVYLQTVAKLIEIGPDRFKETPDGVIKKLRDMSWWPPRQLTDFMLSSLSGMETERVWELDAQWRRDRVLSPEEVLKTLKSSKQTSQLIADSVQDLENGKIPMAIRRISEHFAERHAGFENELWYGETQAVLKAFLNVSMELGHQGFVARGKKRKGTMSLSEAVDFICTIMKERSLNFGLRYEVEDEKACVVCMTPAQAARMRPASIDALIYVGLENTRSSISITTSSRNVITSILTRTQMCDPLMQARSEFGKIIRATREHLTLERVLFWDKSDAFNSVCLGELLEAYGHTSPKQPLPLPCMNALETKVLDNIAPTGEDKGVIETIKLDPTGTIDEDNRDLILLTPHAKDGEPALPILSASQIDGYLDCPYKWFSQRRLRLNDTDAGFGPMEKGTFIHRVLELTFQKQLAAQLGIELDELDKYYDTHDITERVDDCFVNDETEDLFKEIAQAEFQSHYDHQFLTSNKKGQQLLVPHNLQERLELRNILGDVFRFISWHNKRLQGFEPRLFEYRFGDKRHKDIEYAGVRFTGSIDRVDVDKHGNAIIIDYKYKNFGNDDSYALYGDPSATVFELPRHVQTLIYAQVLRRARPDLKPVASLYLSPKSCEVAGAFGNEDIYRRVMGETPMSKRMEKHVVNSGQDMNFIDMLDRTEYLIGQKIDQMKRGEIPAVPRDKDACRWCPVAFCEKRINA